MKIKTLLIAAALLMATYFVAQNAQDFSKVEIKTTKLTDKFHRSKGTHDPHER